METQKSVLKCYLISNAGNIYADEEETSDNRNVSLQKDADHEKQSKLTPNQKGVA